MGWFELGGSKVGHGSQSTTPLVLMQHKGACWRTLPRYLQALPRTLEPVSGLEKDAMKQPRAPSESARRELHAES
jgi:hypothetical protein